MVVFLIFLTAVCYVCYAIIRATNNGWLLNYGESTVAFIQTLCKLIFFSTIISPLVSFILVKIL